uniref:BrnT family toxin n=1 Tax=Magnetococcus massalia (strain MO-1) TaxID=451514 RepID=A0A1S7LE74_MAGMO|nr:conserved protein of unknown function [Candidatus Magnetococcus massalia]
MYEWDDNKNVINIAKHGVDFAIAEEFDWESALVIVDDREDYHEIRFRALGMIGERLHAMVYTCR